MSPRPISEPSSRANGCGKVALILFSIAFMFMGCLGTFFFFARPVNQTLDARSWPAVNCRIISSRVEQHHDSDGTTYSPKIRYSYSVNNRDYESGRYGLYSRSTSGQWAHKVVASYPVGADKKCFYDPNDPKMAVLNRDFSWFLLIGLIPVVFVILGATMLWAGITGKFFRPPGSVANRALKQGSLPTGQSDQSLPDFEAQTGPQKLRPESTRLMRVIGIGVVALIWNTIVGVFVVGMFRDQPGLFTMLFLIPFVLVGIGLVAGFVYQLLATFNPTVEIALSNGAVPLGETVEVAWQLEGNVGRIQRLTVSILGIESATYTRGTSTYTDTETFTTLQVVDTDDSSQMGFGSSTIEIPADSMHTFTASNNSITWTVEVRGEIASWPDIHDKFPFLVKPQGYDDRHSA